MYSRFRLIMESSFSSGYGTPNSSRSSGSDQDDWRMKMEDDFSKIFGRNSGTPDSSRDSGIFSIEEQEPTMWHMYPNVDKAEHFELFLENGVSWMRILCDGGVVFDVNVELLADCKTIVQMGQALFNVNHGKVNPSMEAVTAPFHHCFLKEFLTAIELYNKDRDLSEWETTIDYVPKVVEVCLFFGMEKMLPALGKKMASFTEGKTLSEARKTLRCTEEFTRAQLEQIEAEGLRNLIDNKLNKNRNGEKRTRFRAK